MLLSYYKYTYIRITMRRHEDYEYWKHPPKGYPKTIWWEVIAGPKDLSILQEYDLIFDERDLQIRKIERINNESLRKR